MESSLESLIRWLSPQVWPPIWSSLTLMFQKEVAERIVAEDVAAGRLIRLLPEWRGPAVPVYAVTETRLLPAKTLRFIEFLQEQLAPPPAG